MPEIKVNPNFNPFQSSNKSRPDNAIQAQGFGKIKPAASSNWGDFYGDAKQKEEEIEIEQSEIMAVDFESDLETERKKPIQINDKYILTSVKAGFLLIDQYRAHVRILYDRLIEKMSRKAAKSQQLLFPEELEIDVAEKIIWNQLMPTLVAIGFELELTDEVLKIVAVPMELGEKNPQQVLASLMDEFKQTNQDNIDFTEVVVRSVAAGMAIKGGTKLSTGELEFIVDALFASSSPYISPQGKKIIESFSMDEITKRFN